MKFKILRIINRYNVGGISYNVAYLSRYISDEFETKVIGGKQENHEQSSLYLFEDLGLNVKMISIIRRSINPLYDILSILIILYYLIKYKPHIIHTHASKAGLLGRLAAIIHPFKNFIIVHTFHGNVFEGYFSGIKRDIIINIERFLAKKTNAIIALSNSQKNDLALKYRICSANKIFVIPLGFDLKKFSTAGVSNKYLIREEFGIRDDYILVTIVGRIVPIKNHHLFIDIISSLKNKYHVKVKALIVGDGNMKNCLIDYSKKSNLEVCSDEIITDADLFFTSWRNDLPNIYAGSDYVILTSLNEGTPVSIIEAMASRKVVLSTNVGGVSDIIDSKSGYICDHNPESFISVILELMKNPEERSRIQENAYNRVINLYDYSRLCSDFEDLYKQLAKNNIDSEKPCK